MYLGFKDLVKLDKASHDFKWPGFQAIGTTATISGELLTKLPASLIIVLLLALGKCLKRQAVTSTQFFNSYSHRFTCANL